MPSFCPGSARWSSRARLVSLLDIFWPGRKGEPLKYCKAATAASLSWETLRTGIQSTVAPLSGCLQNGENVAVLLKDIGILLIDGLAFRVKFFDFLEQLSGKEKFRRAAFKVSSSFSLAQAEP